MFRQVTKDEWVKSLRWGDIGLVRGRTLFGWFQNLERRQQKVDQKATHGLIVKDSPVISEADGTRVFPDRKIDRYCSNHHKMWIFRRRGGIGSGLRRIGEAYLAGAEQANYGWAGIREIGKRFFSRLIGKTYIPKDRVGLFCTEHCSRFAISLGLPWTDKLPQEVTPSSLLDWMLDTAVPAGTWELVAFYDQGAFRVSDR